MNNNHNEWNLSCKHERNDCCDKSECGHNSVDYGSILNAICDDNSESTNNKVCCVSNYNRRNKEELWQIIMQASFALDDIKLFLDTHPCDKAALKVYDEYKNIRKVALMEYETQYGPISAYDVKVCDYWDWVNKPWPWEGEC
jgi:spore coat protein JB